MLAAALAEDFPQRVLLVVTATPADAERWLADLAVLREDGARLYPQREALGEEEPHLEIAGERVETIAAVLAGQGRGGGAAAAGNAGRGRATRAGCGGRRAPARRGHERAGAVGAGGGQCAGCRAPQLGQTRVRVRTWWPQERHWARAPSWSSGRKVCPTARSHAGQCDATLRTV